ncbi:nuclear transport factor 2 family protein [Microbulbifer sp. ZKSA006]|uniref:nuclear transport factor 2 family protein n=1 Tax=Microbulbifer sp. ZKSA006 TaxID=3243390 RepID=UPI00403A5F18
MFRLLGMLSAVIFIASLLNGCSHDEAKHKAVIEDMEAYRSIMDLQTDYLLLIDRLFMHSKGMRPSEISIADLLFTEDAEWILHAGANERRVFSGREGLAELFKTFKNSFNGSYVKHFTTNPKIEISGDTATSKETLLILWSIPNTDKNHWVIGSYKNEFRKTSDGVWRFESKTTRIENKSIWDSVAYKLECPTVDGKPLPCIERPVKSPL